MIVAVTEIVTIHVEMLPAAVLPLENVRVLAMHLHPAGMSAMVGVEGAIADLLLVREVPQEEEAIETEVAAQKVATGGEIVIEMIGMTGMTETIYGTSETTVMTLVHHHLFWQSC